MSRITLNLFRVPTAIKLSITCLEISPQTSTPDTPWINSHPDTTSPAVSIRLKSQTKACRKILFCSHYNFLAFQLLLLLVMLKPQTQF